MQSFTIHFWIKVTLSLTVIRWITVGCVWIGIRLVRRIADGRYVIRDSAASRPIRTFRITRLTRVSWGWYEESRRERERMRARRTRSTGGENEWGSSNQSKKYKRYWGVVIKGNGCCVTVVNISVKKIVAPRRCKSFAYGQQYRGSWVRQQ